MTEQVEQSDGAAVSPSDPINGREYYGKAARQCLHFDMFETGKHLAHLGMKLAAIIAADDDPHWPVLLDQLATAQVALEAARARIRTEEDDIPF